MADLVQVLRRRKQELDARWIEWRHRHLDHFFFIHINKTAGTSVQRVLNIPFDHQTAMQKAERFGHSEWNKRFTFSVVRNPWDRAISSYLYRLETRQGILADGKTAFSEWARFTYRDRDPRYCNPDKKMDMPQYHWLCDDTGELMVDCICRFETLDRDFEPVARRIGRSPVLPHLKATTRTHYRDYYDEVTKNIVARAFEIDIDYFKYTF